MGRLGTGFGLVATRGGIAIGALMAVSSIGLWNSASHATVITTGDTGIPNVDEFLSIGSAADGSMEINGGSVVNSIDGGGVGGGFQVTGEVLITGANSEWNIGGDDGSGLFIADADPNFPPGGTGIVTVENGGLLNLVRSPTNGGPFITLGGRAGDATLNVNAGGTVTLGTNVATESLGISIAGAQQGTLSTGVMNVAGGEVRIEGGNAFIDVARTAVADGVADELDTPTGSLRVTQGGSVLVQGGPNSNSGMGFAMLPNSKAELLIDGAGSAVRIIADDASDPFSGATVGRQGLGEATISDGGLFHIDSKNAEFGGLSIGGFDATNNGTGSMIVTGTDSLLQVIGDSPGIFVGQAAPGELRLENGGRAETHELFLGIDAPGNGTLHVGVGSELALSGPDALNGDAPFFSIGGFGTGVAEIHGGKVTIDASQGNFADVTVGGFLNAPFGGNGTLTVDGPTGELSTTPNGTVNTASLFVGANGLGEVNIKNGAKITGFNGVFAGFSAGSNGTITVDDASLEVLGLFGADIGFAGFGPFVGIGFNSTGIANVVNGGSILIDPQEAIADPAKGAALVVGGDGSAAGNGNLLVRGPGSEIRIAGTHGRFSIGDTGIGVTRVDQGGRIIVEDPTGRGFVGENPGSVGTLIINGPTSLVDAASLFTVGEDLLGNDGGTGLVFLQDGATLRADEVRVRQNGALVGNGTIDGTLTVQDGVVSVIGNSPGALTVDALNFVSGVLEFEVAGTGPGEFSTLEILGDASFTGGTILFTFIDDFLPSAGDMLDFLIAPNLLAFENVAFDFQGVAPGFEFDVAAGGSGLEFVANNDAQAVPEPATLSLLGIGVCGIGFVVWRTRKRHALRLAG